MIKIIQFFTIFVILFSSQSYASMIVTPTRVNFDEKDLDIKSIRVINSGNKVKSYRIKMVKMKEKNGKMVEIKKGEDYGSGKFIDEFAFFSPKRFRLNPKESQVIRVMVKKNKYRAAPKGEYRSHMLISEENRSTPVKKNKKLEKGVITLDIRPVFHVSMPVIANRGAMTGKAKISDIKIMTKKAKKIKGKKQKDQTFVTFSIKRSGNSSVYGDIYVSLIDKNKEVYDVGLMVGRSVLLPSNEKKSKILLNLPKNVQLVGSKLKLSYYHREFNGSDYSVNKSKILDEEFLEL